ncbi:hypothetical protein FJT64_009025 [Amphibalanus amphitrite]|uniref:VWFC domain-containing protein n=1 Tax=Amphibalanus amphitrite TaxID=1232801 RepID=A0A6A4VST1_AMPAM|nr:hypothetical protein FJT64_009025 [Amphibalanus amphitrite]
MRRLALLAVVSAALALPVQDVPTVFKAKEDPKALCYTTGPVAGDPCTYCKCFSPGNCIPVTAECDWDKNAAEHTANGCEAVYKPGICCPTVKCPDSAAAEPAGQGAEAAAAGATRPEQLAAEISNQFPNDELIKEVIAEITGPGAEAIGDVISEINAAPAEEAIQKEISSVDPHPQHTQEVVLEMTPDQIRKVIAALAPEEGVVTQTEAIDEVLSEMATETEPATSEAPVTTADPYQEQGDVHTEIITKKEPIVIASKEPLIVVSDQPVIVVNEDPVLSNDIYSDVPFAEEKAALTPSDELLPAAAAVEETVFLDTVPEPVPEGSGEVAAEAPVAEVEGSGYLV